MNLHDLLVPGIPVLEKAIRTVAVYGGLALLLRLGGRRDLAQLNSFDLIVMLLLSNVVQNAVIGNDNSLGGGLLGAAVLVAINAAAVRSAQVSSRFRRLFEGEKVPLIEHGEIRTTTLRRLGLRKEELLQAIRSQDAEAVEQVESAVLTPGGNILVSLRPEYRNATSGDIAALRRELQELRESLAPGGGPRR